MQMLNTELLRKYSQEKKPMHIQYRWFVSLNVLFFLSCVYAWYACKCMHVCICGPHMCADSGHVCLCLRPEVGSVSLITLHFLFSEAGALVQPRSHSLPSMVAPRTPPQPTEH